MKRTKKQRIARLDAYMEIMETLYRLEPALLVYTDWNSNEDSYKQMVKRIREGK
jgi:hypothetical protein